MKTIKLRMSANIVNKLHQKKAYSFSNSTTAFAGPAIQEGILEKEPNDNLRRLPEVLSFSVKNALVPPQH